MVNSTAKRTLFSRFLVRLAAVAAVLALALTVQSSSSESVRFAAEPRPGESVQAELVRLQQQTGLSLATFGFGFNMVLFDKRSLVQIPISSGTALVTGSVSQDGSKIIVKRFDPSASDSLELLRTDGSYEREFPLTHGSEMRSGVESLCWSYDESKLAMGVHRGSPEIKLEILDLNSGADARVASGAKRLSSQCWSLDGKSIVYESGDGVRTCEVKTRSPQHFLLLGERHPRGRPMETGSRFVRAIRSTKSVPTAETRKSCSIAKTCIAHSGGRPIRTSSPTYLWRALHSTTSTNSVSGDLLMRWKAV